MYRLTCYLAARQSLPCRGVMLGALRGDQVETNRFIGTLAGSASITEFYSPVNLLRLVGKRCLRNEPVSRLGGLGVGVEGARTGG
jgi:hypothetical protein